MKLIRLGLVALIPIEAIGMILLNFFVVGDQNLFGFLWEIAWGGIGSTMIFWLTKGMFP